LTGNRAALTINAMVNNSKKITAIFAALADPTRRRILVRLSNSGDRPVTALAKPFRISLPAISRHLSVLEKARLIQRRREGRVHVIHVRAAGFKPAQDWLAQCAAAWDFSFDKLDQLLRNEQRKEDQDEVRAKHQR
jgi:DNA-binding transcriptional ArsR family regulator